MEHRPHIKLCCKLYILHIFIILFLYQCYVYNLYNSMINYNPNFSRSRFLKIEKDSDVFIFVGRELKVIGPR